MKYFLNLLLLLFFFGKGVVSAQNINFEKRAIKTLTSKNFSGRGYVDNGMQKAAFFLAKKFSKMKLKSFDQNYFQEFEFPINYIEEATLEFNHQPLLYGIDYIVYPNSASHPKENATNKVKYIYDNAQKLASLSTSQSDSTTLIIDEKWKNLHHEMTKTEVKSSFNPKFRAQNIIGYLVGKEKDSLIVITAHYDHLGKVQQVIFPGANDNASGVGMLLGLAKHFGKQPPKHTLVFIAFAAEEAGLIGSQYFVENPLFDLNRIKMLINLDILGTGEDGIQVVNGTIHAKEFEVLQSINRENKYVPQIKTRGEACNSDHCFFHALGIKSFYIYTLGGKSYYHDTRDDYKSLSLDKFAEIKQLLIDFVERI